MGLSSKISDVTEQRSMTTVAQVLNQSNGPTYSFEFFPPKTEQGTSNLMQAVEELEPLKPDFVSVTYGASGTNRDRTLGVTVELAKRSNLRVIGHITCTAQSVDEVKRAIDAYGEAGIRNILAIRGDMPGGPRVAWEKHPQGLENATELVELIKSRGDFCVGVGAFPDGHLTSDLELDAQILLAKQQAGAEFAVTQLFFEPKHYFDLVDRVRNVGVTMPIVPGIMPVSSVKQLGKFVELSGADIPARVAETLLRVPDDPMMVRVAGSVIASDLCKEMLTGGAPGLHFYTQNRSVATREILAMLRARGY